MHMYQAQTQDDRTWGLLAHLLALAGYAVGFGHIIAPLVIYLVKKDTSPYVAQEAKESLNFQITMTIGWVVGAILLVVLVGIVVLIIVGLCALIFPIIGAIKANEGSGYRYPFAIRLVK